MHEKWQHRSKCLLKEQFISSCTHSPASQPPKNITASGINKCKPKLDIKFYEGHQKFPSITFRWSLLGHRSCVIHPPELSCYSGPSSYLMKKEKQSSLEAEKKKLIKTMGEHFLC